MTYQEWNKILSEYFFNIDNAGRDVYLYLSKDDVITIGKLFLPGKTDDEILKDYLQALYFDEKGMPLSLIQAPLELHKSWNKQDSPPYIAYLLLFTIPLTEPDDGKFNTSNYYGRVNTFLNRYSLLNATPGREINTGNFQQLNHLWQSLEEWSILTRNCELGIFELKKFGNPNWIYVGKPLSQCLLTPKAIRRLGEVFLVSGFVPHSYYQDDQFRHAIISSGRDLLELKDNVKKIIRDDDNELGHSIIEIVKREYQKWSGESHRLESQEVSGRARRNFTVAPLMLQFEINQHEEKVIFSYRMFSTNDYPDDLQFNGFENIYEGRGWSKKLQIPYQQEFEMKDQFNKWIARFPKKDVRIFTDAAVYQMSNQYWIETEKISKSRKMYLLCENSVEESISTWGRHFPSGLFRKEDLDGLPKNHTLFSFQNPREDHPFIASLKIPSQKEIEFVGGLNIGFRKFLNFPLPEVEIGNADGTEKVMLEYKSDGQKVSLTRKYTNSNRWTINENVMPYSDFVIKIDGESLPGYETTYTIISADNSSTLVDDSLLPLRDSFGKNVLSTDGGYCKGINVFNINHRRAQFIYESLFSPAKEDLENSYQNHGYENSDGNLLLSFLTLKKTSTTEDFYKAFELLHYNKFNESSEDSSFNYSRTKRAALNYYDYLGFIDYESDEKKIIINPTQLILIPTDKGRKALLVGARDDAFIRKFLLKANDYDLGVEINRQDERNEHLLLPDAITVKAFAPASERYGITKLEDFARELQIKFTATELVQPCLQELSSSLSEYRSGLIASNEVETDEYDWARKVFDIQSLSFVKQSADSFDKKFSLIEYKLNEYTFLYRLWMDGKCYSVDRNWGKYLILKQSEKQVILYDEKKQKVAIPIELPLPRLLAKSIILLSGIAPIYKNIAPHNTNIPFRLYENVPSIFIKNLFKKLEQNVLNFNL